MEHGAWGKKKRDYNYEKIRKIVVEGVIWIGSGFGGGFCKEV